MTCKKQAEAQPIDGLAIVKETSTLGKLIIKGVPKEEAKRMIVENHYSHKWNEGGCGTIYKASNFRYYGFHYTRFLRNKRTEEIIHEQNLTDTTSLSTYLRSNIAYLIGDLEVLQIKTYRYIYPLCKHFRFIKPEKPYPQYEKGIEPVEWNRDKRKIKENIIMLLDKVAA